MTHHKNPPQDPAPRGEILSFPGDPSSRLQALDGLDDDALGDWVDDDLERALARDSEALAELSDALRAQVEDRPSSGSRLLAWAALFFLAVGLLLIWRTVESRSPEAPSAESFVLRTETAGAGVAPVLESPADGLLRWTPVEGAVGYRVELLDAQGVPVLLRQVDSSSFEGSPELRLGAGHEALANAIYARVTASLADGRSVSSEILDLDGS